MAKRKRKGDFSRQQKDIMIRRSQRYVTTVFIYRRESWDDGTDSQIDRHGFLAPVPPQIRREVLRLAHEASQHWEIACIAYCRAQDGKEYQETSSIRTGQLLSAWCARRDDSGDIVRDESGQPIFDDQLSPFIKATMESAEDSCNPRHIYDRGVIIRPWCRRWPSMRPVLKRIKESMGLDDSAINDIAGELEAAA